jgi:hypothetical protein
MPLPVHLLYGVSIYSVINGITIQDLSAHDDNFFFKAAFYLSFRSALFEFALDLVWENSVWRSGVGTWTK